MSSAPSTSKTPDSLMHENFGYRTEFDAKNRDIIRKNRACAFAK